MALPVRAERFADLDAETLYQLLRLRVDVFVVEQNCAYPDLDGRDLEPDAWHCWIADDDGPIAYLRVLAESQGSRIGRVVTAPRARGAGHARRLLRHALGLAPRPVVVSAQAHLEAWYAGFGFRTEGDPFDEDGILHVPMRLSGSSSAERGSRPA